jgi:hypothetical protein
MESAGNQSAVWPGVNRGLMLGVYVAIGLHVAIAPFLFYAAWTSPSAREDILGRNQAPLSHLGGIVGGFCMTAFCCAVAGGAIMGAIAFVRSRRRA